MREPWSRGRVSSAKTWNVPAVLVADVDRGEGGAVCGGGEAAGVAVGEDVEHGVCASASVLEELQPVLADGAADGVVFLEHRQGFGEEALVDLRDHLLLGAGALLAGFAGDALHAVEGPEEVDGGGAAGGEVVADLVEAAVEVGEGVGA